MAAACGLPLAGGVAPTSAGVTRIERPWVDAARADILSVGLRSARGPVLRVQTQRVIIAGGGLLVPPLFWLEIVNVLACRYRYAPDAVVEAVFEVEQVGLRTAEVGRPMALAVVDAVARLGITAYDAAYLVLAESADARLLTADVTLAAAAGERAIMVGPRGAVGEAHEAYAAGTSWARWRGASAYLAELRSRVERAR